MGFKSPNIGVRCSKENLTCEKYGHRVSSVTSGNVCQFITDVNVKRIM